MNDYTPEELKAAADGFLAWVNSIRAAAWDEGALWAAVETGVLTPHQEPHAVWLAPGDNPYRKETP